MVGTVLRVAAGSVVFVAGVIRGYWRSGVTAVGVTGRVFRGLARFGLVGFIITVVANTARAGSCVLCVTVRGAAGRSAVRGRFDHFLRYATGANRLWIHRSGIIVRGVSSV